MIVVALLAACTAIDAIATGILLLGTPVPATSPGVAATALHVIAALLLAGLSRAPSARRLLCLAAALALPFAGFGVAAAVLLTRGRGSAAMERRSRARGREALSVIATRRLGGALSTADALVCGDEDERRAALSALARRADPEAMALLRWAAAGRDPDLALSAAMTLDEINERAERRLIGRSGTARVRHAAA